MNLEAVFKQHHAALVRYLTWYTGDPDEAADAAQEAYLRWVQRPPTREDHARAWLFAVATNVVRDGWRRRHTELLSAPERVPIGDPPPGPHAAVERDERCQAVRRILARLSGREKTVLLMRAEGFSHREIAEVVGTTTRSIGTMIARALRKLSSELGEAGEKLL